MISKSEGIKEKKKKNLYLQFYICISILAFVYTHEQSRK